MKVKENKRGLMEATLMEVISKERNMALENNNRQIIHIWVILTKIISKDKELINGQMEESISEIG